MSDIQYNLIVDISYCQPDMLWEHMNDTVPSQNRSLKGVYIKLTEGVNIIDSQALKHAEQCTLPKGYYHFLRPSEGSASDQATYFYNVYSQCPTPDLKTFLDVEDNGGLSQSDLTQYIEDWISTFLQLSGESDIIIYGGLRLNEWLKPGHNLGRFGLMLAEYGIHEQNIILPYGWHCWVLWQFTETGSIPGCKQNVDLSYNKDFTQIQNSLKS